MKVKFYLAILVAALVFVSCSKEFLETEPTEVISSDQIADASEINPDLQGANVGGIYSTMYAAFTGGTTGHTDFGQKGYDIYTDMLSSDMVLAGLTYGWYSSLSRMQATTDYTTNENYQPWRYYYRIVFSANNVIDQLGGNDVVPESDELRHYMGQAKALRGYAYFYLAQLYANEYDPAVPMIPIYTDTGSPNQPLSTGEEVYGQIISDLTSAIELLDDFNRGAKNQVDQWVAKGLLAYTYGAMGENEQVVQITDDIINNGGFSLMTAEEVVGTVDPETVTDATPLGVPVGGGFNDVNTPGWMWGVDLTLDSGLDLVSWWGQIDIFTYSYAYVGDEKSIDIGLYNAIPENDVRKGQFVPVFDENQYLPINKFYAPGAPDSPGRSLGAQRYIETDYVYMRVAEMYLLHAEASAKLGDEAGARDALAALLTERMDDYSYINSLSGQALLDEIYLQTRIELWGEGKSYLAMKRNKATITRGSNHLTSPGLSIPYNDDRLTFEIPEAEVINNPEIN